MILCHDLEIHETRGFLKGGPQILEALAYLKRSGLDIVHPMLLPVIVLSLKIGSKSETSQQEAQNQIRLIEVRLRNTRPVRQAFISEDEGVVLEEVNADLSACHKKVWKRPETYLELIDEFHNSLQAIAWKDQRAEFSSIRLKMRSRVELLRQRMRGIQSSAHTTLCRIDMQRSVLHNILLNQQNQIALQVEKRKQKQETVKELAVSRWNRTQLLLSLLGSIFLPITVVAVSFLENKSFQH
jgi:Mg2+ and Co2+ transporter CorA